LGRGGVQLCTLDLPRFPPKYIADVSPYENWLRKFKSENEFALCNLSTRIDVMKDLWNHKELYHFCNDFDSFEDFFDAFQIIHSYIDINGLRRFADYASRTLNTQDGRRATTDQPLNPKRTIFFIGPSIIYGYGAADKYTFESILQRYLNKKVAEQGFIVYNQAFAGPDLSRDISILRALPYKKGDIVFFWLNKERPVWGIPCCDLRLKSVRPHNYGDIFNDGHFSKNGNRMIADGIFEFLQKHNFFEEILHSDGQLPNSRENDDIDRDEDENLRQYKRKLKKFFFTNISPKVGAIVMNCNPFTLGHRYLVEQALKQCDKLVVFVVEEDKSMFPFADRIKLVKENLSDLENVSVMPSGQFIISSRTFSEYFNKESLQERSIDTSLDVTLFANDIAPCMNITARFAGAEPFDSVTRQYNESMSRILPQYGIKFIEIPRLKSDGEEISASKARELLKTRQFDKLKKLVPNKTLKYLKEFVEA